MALLPEANAEDRRDFECQPHPWYGPCDAFGGDGDWCSECARLIHFLHDELTERHCHGRIRVTRWKSPTPRLTTRTQMGTDMTTDQLQREVLRLDFNAALDLIERERPDHDPAEVYWSLVEDHEERVDAGYFDGAA